MTGCGGARIGRVGGMMLLAVAGIIRADPVGLVATGIIVMFEVGDLAVRLA